MAREQPKPVFDRTPPQSIEAERSVLGAMLLNPDAVGTAVEILRDDPADIFYVDAHQHIFTGILSLARENVPVDMVTLTEALTREGSLEQSGGVSYIAELTDAVPTSANVEYYAKIVLEAALRRKLITICSRCAGEAYKAEGEVDDLLDLAESEIFSIAQQRQLNPITKVADLLEAGIKRIEEQMKTDGGITGIPTGFTKLDEMLSGMQPSDMLVLAARPSVGKTAFCLNVAANAANTHKKGVLLFSLEMSKEQLVNRLLCMVGRVDSGRLRSGFLARAEFPKLQHAAEILSQSHLYIDDTANISVLELRSKARKHAQKHPLDLLIIDYLQLMSGSSRSESRQVEISEISRSIKGLARELKCPIIALSQLSREAEKDEGGTPKLSHLRESGAIEQDADVVMMLSRLGAAEQEGRENVIRLTVAKQRNGPTGVVELLFEKNIQRFLNLGGDDGLAAAGESVPYQPFDGDDSAVEEYYEEDDTPF
ncbi:MAG: replicative DNA helicase [Candidatus Hydrogenedentes bacterium]|nr:replicative DNA helicase [Candidatus Hydrogenedentota bacterium]